MCCVAAFVCKSTYPDIFEVKVHSSPVTVYSLFAKGIFNKENPLFIGGSVSRLMFCYHSMIYTALNLNNNLCWTPQATGGMNQKSLQAKALLKGRINLVCRLLSAGKISITISHHRSVKNSLNSIVYFF